MTTAPELHSLRAVLQAQRHMLEQASGRLDTLAPGLEKAHEHADQLRSLSGLMNELEQKSCLLCAGDIADYDPREIDSIYQRRQEAVARETSALAFVNWDQFVRNSMAYCAEHDLDCSLPWEAFLSNDDLVLLKQEVYGAQYRWDKWDYTFVGAAGVLASLADYLLVAIPKTMTYGGVEQKGSPITAFLKKHVNSEEGTDTWFANWAKKLEETCEVPYDRVADGLDGMTGRTHRLQTFGHDPVLGFLFGILDIMRGTITGFSYDKLTGNHVFECASVGEAQSVSLIEAILTQIGHLVSDLGTKTGIQPPFFTLFQGINIKSPFSPKGRTIGQIARWMYLNGYDFRHFITMEITPATIEIILRAYLMIRHYTEHGEAKFLLANNPKYRSMLLSAHAIACAGNAGKVALYQGNPLAINYAEWLALIRYLLPSLKYWLFDRSRLQIEHMTKITDEGWTELATAGDRILERSYADTIEVVSLGRQG